MFTTLIYTKKKYSFLEEYLVNTNTYIIPQNSENFDGVEINGSGIIDNRFVEHNLSYKKSEFINVFSDVENIQYKMKGSLCLYLSHNNSNIILPDPLGGAILYYFDSPSVKIFSNSINCIIKVMKEMKIEVKKNLSYFLENIATGNGGLNNSPYKKIFAIKQFHYVSINNGKIIIKMNKKILEKIKAAKTKTYHQILNEAIEDIDSNVKIISDYEAIGSKYAHLTGGFDSRLVLAGLLSNGSQNKFRYFCSGNKGTPDKDISIALSKHFGLKQTNDSGQSILKYPSSLEEEVMWSYNFTGGITKSINPKTEKSGNLILSGGYGELLRSFYSKDYDFILFNSYKEIVSKTWKNLKSSELFTEDFIEDFTENFREIIYEGLKLGFPEESILDYYYIAIRNRYFVGQISFYASVFNSRFDLLYSCNTAINSLFINQSYRNNNFLGLDILRYFNEELMSLPFDTPRISDKYQKVRGVVEERKYKNNYNSEIEFIEIKNNTKKPSRKKPTQEHRDKANQMKARLWQVVEMDNTQNELSKMLDYHSSKKFEESMNIKKINQLIYFDIKNRSDLRTLHLLYSNLIWWHKSKE